MHVNETILTPLLLHQYFENLVRIRFRARLPCGEEVNLLSDGKGNLYYNETKIPVKTLEDVQKLIFGDFKVAEENKENYTIRKLIG